MTECLTRILSQKGSRKWWRIDPYVAPGTDNTRPHYHRYGRSMCRPSSSRGFPMRMFMCAAYVGVGVALALPHSSAGGGPNPKPTWDKHADVATVAAFANLRASYFALKFGQF